MSHDHSRNLRALLAALAPLGLVTAGCGSSLGDFTGRVCLLEQGGLSDLAPADGIDFIALRQSGTLNGATSNLAEWGTACATASDPAACQSALAALPLDAALAQSGYDLVTWYDLAFTSGDSVGRVTDRSSLLALLGTIDTPNEAALVALAAGHEMPCDENNFREENGVFVLLGTRGTTCGGDIEHYEISVTSSGEVTEGESEVVEEGDPNCVIGRRPDALRSRPRRPRSLGGFFANAAQLEAASVYAFEKLAGELVAHRAPRRLVRAALRSSADEVRHARATAALARRFGGRPVRPVIERRPVRSLFDVALDNATEGCVRETFGALVATVQSMRAASPSVRRELRRIAADETRHAALSWAIDAWVRGRLGTAGRRALDEARREAVATLRAEAAREWPAEVATIAGMPGAEASTRLLAGLDAGLWR